MPVAVCLEDSEYFDRRSNDLGHAPNVVGNGLQVYLQPGWSSGMFEPHLAPARRLPHQHPGRLLRLGQQARHHALHARFQRAFDQYRVAVLQAIGKASNGIFGGIGLQHLTRGQAVEPGLLCDEPGAVPLGNEKIDHLGRALANTTIGV